jgi:hypothetical protein
MRWLWRLIWWGGGTNTNPPEPRVAVALRWTDAAPTTLRWDDSARQTLAWDDSSRTPLRWQN